MTVNRTRRILLVAAENGALPKGKVGGVGDVIKGLPPALADMGWETTVITPAYGMFHTLPGSEHCQDLLIPFGGETQSVALYRVPGPDARITHLVLEHPLFSPQGPGKIYCHDGSDRPFATDAGKFALLCAAVANYVQLSEELPDVVHLHDWHAALYLALREFDPALSRLRQVCTVYTIHNLALQGIRPLRHDTSSLEAWFPGLAYDVEKVGDPRYHDCVNPMALAIRLAENLNTVSPSYAREILEANDPAIGFHGGEGLEQDLRRADSESRLTGILNGCEYDRRAAISPKWSTLLDVIVEEAGKWHDSGAMSGEDLGGLAAKLERFRGGRPASVLTSIGRMTSQKVELFLQETPEGSAALDAILNTLGDKGVFIMLGSGDRELEQQMAACAARHSNLVYLCGYSESLSQLLYLAGDMFLMPSSFEPCGISQLLAMKNAQPCVVHAVGGLKDTVEDGVTGFVFDGDSSRDKAGNFVKVVAEALSLKLTHPRKWASIRNQAAAQRFTWDLAARHYQEGLYGHPGG